MGRHGYYCRPEDMARGLLIRLRIEAKKSLEWARARRDRLARWGQRDDLTHDTESDISHAHRVLSSVVDRLEALTAPQGEEQGA